MKIDSAAAPCPPHSLNTDGDRDSVMGQNTHKPFTVFTGVLHSQPSAAGKPYLCVK